MRLPSIAIIPALLTLALAGCYPAKPTGLAQNPIPSAPPTNNAPTIAPASPPSPIPPPAPSPAIPASPLSAPRLATRQISGITFQGVTFDSRTHRLAVLDQPAGPGSRFPDSQTAARSLRGLAATNAGFFTPEGSPLGLVISNGNPTGSWNSASSLGSGVWFENSGKNPAIARREALGRSAASSMPQLIQAGPMLIDNGKAVSGLDSAKTSARTLILWDGTTRWWLGCTTPCSLAELSQALATGGSTTGGPVPWPVRQALNFDGGRSSDLWVSGSIPGGPLTRRPIWNKPVRNFLVLLPR